MGNETIEYLQISFADNKMRYIHGCDANFGIFRERDLRIARKLKEVCLEKHYPTKFFVAWAKNTTDQILPIARELRDGGVLGGVTLAETISDTVGAMVTSNTESGITVAYQDADNTLDFTVGTLNQDTTGTAATVTGAAQTNITSVGTLSGLAVSGNQTVGGTLGVTGAATTSYTTIGSSAKAFRNTFIHSSAPQNTDGAVGDIWITYS